METEEEKVFRLKVENQIDKFREENENTDEEIVLALTMLNKAVEILDEEYIVQVSVDLLAELTELINHIDSQF